MSKGRVPYKHEELIRVGPQRTFTGRDVTEIAFPLGGIGTGTISLGGRGNLRDFEIFGRPAKGNVLPFTFFALRAKPEGGQPITKILEGKVPPPYRSGFGEPQNQLQGLPRFEDAYFHGEYPVAGLELADDEVPVKASLRAWNPFIPLNVKDSALPVAIFEWTFANPRSKPVEISLVASTSNPLTAKAENGQHTGAGALNAYQAVRDLKGVLLTHPKADPSDPATGSLALTTTWSDVDVQTRWYRGGWWDKCHIFWDEFRETGRLTPVLDAEPGAGDVSSLALRAVVPAGKSVTMPVYITWLFAHMANPWPPEGMAEPKPLETYAGAQFDDAWAVAEYVTRNISRLRSETDLWKDTIFSSTLPAHVLDAVTSQASIMRSPTCFLLADGSFFGWEGCSDNGGCCHGNCTHVWNYEQAVAFLFPQLERTMRQTEFLYNTRDTGNMAFRSQLPRGSGLWHFKPCADGQMGTIIQVYRDWQLSGDDSFLKEVWPKVKLALEYAWTMTPDKLTPPRNPGERSIDSPWDPDKDGVMEGEQHNTYDIEFFGPNTMCTAMYLGALRACEAMALHLGETEKAEEYRSIYQRGQYKVEHDLWNGDYYTQKVMLVDGVTVPDNLKSPASTAECGPTCACKQSPGGKAPALGDGDIMPKYQYGEGCLSDQLLGQWACHVAGIGHILDKEHVRTAVKSIFDNNFRPHVGDFGNVQRVYALNDEAGLLLCSWPHGNRPALPFVYSDEVWTGIEYHVAAHLIYEGWIDEGLTVVKGVRDRYAGYNRNPWNEVECGHHYARAMSSWSVKLALDGYTFSLVDGRLGFAPRVNTENYRTFWSTGTGWGRYSQQPSKGRFELEVLHGAQTLKQLDLADLTSGKVKVTGPSGKVAAQVQGKSVVLEHPVALKAGDVLAITAQT